MLQRLFCIALVIAAVGAAGEQPDARAQWEALVGSEMRDEPAFQFVVEDPALPRVLLIGDSISIGYTQAVRELLADKANVLRIPVNGGPTIRGMESLDAWLGTAKWDIIHFNWGLHDVKRLVNGKMDIGGEWQVGADQYEKNLDALVTKMKATGARLIWAATTPIPEGAKGRIRGDEMKVNAIAAKVMEKHGVTVNDLYSHVFPDLAKYQHPRDVHFTAEGSKFLAEKVAEAIAKALPTGK